MLYFKTILQARLIELEQLHNNAEAVHQKYSYESLIRINKNWLRTVNYHISKGNLHIEAIGIEL